MPMLWCHLFCKCMCGLGDNAHIQINFYLCLFCFQLQVFFIYYWVYSHNPPITLTAVYYPLCTYQYIYARAYVHGCSMSESPLRHWIRYDHFLILNCCCIFYYQLLFYIQSISNMAFYIVLYCIAHVCVDASHARGCRLAFFGWEAVVAFNEVCVSFFLFLFLFVCICVWFVWFLWFLWIFECCTASKSMMPCPVVWNYMCCGIILFVLSCLVKELFTKINPCCFYCIVSNSQAGALIN